MEVKELLNPIEYDLITGQYWKFPDDSERYRLMKLIIDNFRIDIKRLKEFILDITISRIQGIEDPKDIVIERNRNLHDIKLALANIEQYDDITFTMNLFKDKPGRNVPDKIPITATYAIKAIYKILNKLSKQAEPKVRKKNKYKKAEIKEIVNNTFAFIEKHAEGDLSKNDILSQNKKFYFAGLVLASVGILETPQEFETIEASTEYKNYRQFLIARCKAISR